jgi:CHASE2 domain-containing sensor protein/signal transduction histidine kinase
MKSITDTPWRSFPAMLIVMALLLFTDYVGLWAGTNHFMYDLSFRIRGRREPPGKIVIAAVDEKTLGKLGKWPIPRRHYATLLEKIKESDVVGINLLLAEPSEDDLQLADALRRHGRVILPAYLDRQIGRVGPLPSLSPDRIGHAHVEQGIDGIVRRVFHTLYDQGAMLPSFTSTLREAFTATRFPRSDAPFSSQKPSTSTHILQSDPMWINYYGGPETFPSLSVSDVLDGKYPPGYFKGKIVLIGLTAGGIEDKMLTPFAERGSRMAGVEIQANILGNLLDESDIIKARDGLRWLFSIAVFIFYFFLLVRTDIKKGALIGGITLLAGSAALFSLFSRWHFWFNPAIFYLSVTGASVLAYFHNVDITARKLDRAYREISLRLHWESEARENATSERGLLGFLSTGGIRPKIEILSDVIRQLLFEKSLIDAALLSNLHGVLLFDPSGKLILSNQRARDLFPGRPIERCDLKELSDALSPFVLEKVSVESLLMPLNPAEGNVSCTLSLPVPKKSFLKMDISSLSFDHEKYLLCLFTDVTKMKEMEIMKGHIVSVVSHELKQPLTGIMGYSNLLLLKLEGRLREDAAVIYKDSLRMRRLIDTFLDLAKLESGQMPFTRVPIKLIELLNGVLETLKPIAVEKKINIHIEKPDGVPPLSLDPDLTKQCLVNLVENAIKYSPPESDIVIKMTPAEDRFRIDVIDQGYGIAEGDLDKIFDKFYRVRSQTTEKVRGSGLGLAFVKEAVEAQGGTVTVQSALNKGSTFSITFPLTDRS